MDMILGLIFGITVGASIISLHYKPKMVKLLKQMVYLRKRIREYRKEISELIEWK